MSHEDSVRYHIEKHAPFGKKMAGHLGMLKYIGHYPDRSFSLDGKALPALPWDRIVVEWFTDEFFNNLNVWRTTDPVGIEVTEDENRFSDRKAALVLTGQDHEFVSSGEDGIGVNVSFLLPKKRDLSHEDCIQYHRNKHVPLLTHMLGTRLKSYTVYYVDRALHLTDLHGSLLPYDIIVFARLEYEFWKGMEAWRKSPEGIAITEDEKNFIERESAIALECQMHVYIP
jgi:hypothetical protein